MQAAGLVEELADRALRSEFEDVACLEAPEGVQVPRDLIRPDGRSVFQRHGGTRYATRVQLTMEERRVCCIEPSQVIFAGRFTASTLPSALGRAQRDLVGAAGRHLEGFRQ